MFFQKVLKGINGISRAEAEAIALKGGIECNWWRKKGTINEPEVKAELAYDNLIHHLDDYDRPLPPTHRWAALGRTYGDVTAFISTTAGSVQRLSKQQKNIVFPPYLTALKFATDGFSSKGWIFYAYVMTLGTQSVELKGFSEEVRELHVYTDYRKFHHEGEITAKISIPSVNIEKAELYDGPQLRRDLQQGRSVTPLDSIFNPDYISPIQFANIRELL